MTPVYKYLRRFVADEIKALLEKIDSIGEIDSSYHSIKEFTRKANLTILERALLRNALRTYDRRDAMAQAMHIVIYSYPRPFQQAEGFIDRTISVGNGLSSGAGVQQGYGQTNHAYLNAEQARKKVVVRRRAAES